MEITEIKITNFPTKATYFQQHQGNLGFKGKKVARIDGDWYVAHVNAPVYTEAGWQKSWCVGLYTPSGNTIELLRGVTSEMAARNVRNRWAQYLTADLDDTCEEDVIDYYFEKERQHYNMHGAPQMIGEKLW